MSNNKQIQKHLELPHQETIVGINTIQTKPFDNQKTTTMSSNKKTMKLYTEEQIKRTFGFGMNEIMFDGFIRAMTPIELPSDEEIDKKFEPRSTMYELGYRDGAKWLKNKIQGGNK